MAYIVWIVKENNKLILGLPLGEFPRLMISPDYKIKKPIFGTYEDLDEIFRISFQMFEEFKHALTIDYKDSFYKKLKFRDRAFASNNFYYKKISGIFKHR